MVKKKQAARRVDPFIYVPELLTMAEAQERFGIKRRTLTNWARDGILEVRLVGPILVTTPAAMAAAIAQAPRPGRPPKRSDQP